MAPARASESILGVDRFVLPLMLRSPQPWSSARMMMMLGLGARGAAAGAVNSPARKSAQMRPGIRVVILNLERNQACPNARCQVRERRGTANRVHLDTAIAPDRSEERRVGKECRS